MAPRAVRAHVAAHSNRPALPSIAAGRAVLRCEGRSTVRGITVAYSVPARPRLIVVAVARTHCYRHAAAHRTHAVRCAQASNDSRQLLFYTMSGKLRRQLGTKVGRVLALCAPDRCGRVPRWRSVAL